MIRLFLYFITFIVISSAIGLLPTLCICFFIFLIVKLLGIKALSEAEFIGISEVAYNSIPYIYKDDLLVHDIVSCIRAQGDIRVLVFKSRSYIYNDHHPNKLTHRCSGCDLADWNRIINVGVEDNWDKNIQSISQNIIESNGFAQFSKTHNFNENDKNDLKKLFYYFITRPDFSITAHQYLFPFVDRNVKIPIKATSKYDFKHPSSW